LSTIQGITSPYSWTSHPLWKTGQTGEALCCSDETLWTSSEYRRNYGNQPRETNIVHRICPHQKEAYL